MHIYQCIGVRSSLSTSQLICLFMEHVVAISPSRTPPLGRRARRWACWLLARSRWFGPLYRGTKGKRLLRASRQNLQQVFHLGRTIYTSIGRSILLIGTPFKSKYGERGKLAITNVISIPCITWINSGFIVILGSLHSHTFILCMVPPRRRERDETS